MSRNVENILYAADLADGSEPALAYAIGVANRLGARLQVLIVIPDIREKSLIEIDGHVPQEQLDQYHSDRAQRARQHMETQITAFYAVRASEAPARPIIEIEVKESDDVTELILKEAQAHGADLIVMGSRGESALSALLFGSVAQEMARRTQTPLLLIPLGD